MTVQEQLKDAIECAKKVESVLSSLALQTSNAQVKTMYQDMAQNMNQIVTQLEAYMSQQDRPENE